MAAIKKTCLALETTDILTLKIQDGSHGQTCQTKPTQIDFKIGPSNRFWGN